MPSLLERVARTIRRSELIPPGARVVAAVSGGSDSVALVRLLMALEAALEFRVAGLTHVNHQLRGAASDADEAFCRALARDLGLPAYVATVDPAAAVGASPEDRARRARYDALESARTAFGAHLVAVGHTAGDQAETVLMKLVRGAGTRGAAGMAARVGTVVRPLLDVRREELRTWLTAGGYGWVEDASNLALDFTRNRLRHVALPALEEAVGHDATGPLARHAAIARADEELLERLTAEAARAVLRQDARGRSVLEAAALVHLPLSIRRRLVHGWLAGEAVISPTFDQVEAVLELSAGHGTSLQVAGGARVRRNGKSGVLSIERGAPAALPPFSYELRVPGRVLVPEAGVAVQAELADGAAPVDRAPAGHPAGLGRVFVDASAVGSMLRVRSWKAGDALRPLGLGGRKKLQDVFVDAKVPRGERHRIPLVADDRDQVIWVPGLALHADAGVSTDTKAVVVLESTHVGGPE